MIRYLGRARNALIRQLAPPAPAVRVGLYSAAAWAVVALAFLWFSCGGMP